MTNTEAIKILNECRDRGFERTTYTIEEYHTARDMAIKALQEQADRNEFYNWDAPIRHKADGDLISRTSVLDVLKIYKVNLTVIDIIRGLPITNVTIPNKVGHWKPFDRTFGRSIYACSVCNTSADVPTSMGEVMYKYCPNCGAKMGGEEDG